jgi:lantibiotic biosynthesis protein
VLPDRQLLASGGRAERIRERIRDVVHDLARADLSQRGAFARLNVAACFAAVDGSGLVPCSDLVERELEQAIHTLAQRPAPPRLWGGLAGVGWLLSSLVDDVTADEVCGALDERIAGEVTAWTAEYDLLRGLAGFGVYALARRHRAAGAQIAERVVDGLEAAASTGFWTPATWLVGDQRERTPLGRLDLGVAHGIAGAIGLLARFVVADIEPRRSRALLERVVELLVAAVPPREPPRFPAWVTPGDPGGLPARLAWCYGDLGIALALLAAARATDRAEWEEVAVSLASGAAARRSADAGVIDTCLCHGSAGAAHAFHHLFRATGRAVLGEAALYWVDRTLELHRPGEAYGGFPRATVEPGGTRWAPNATLLGGATGVCLALLAAVTRDEPAWDELLLFGVPGR